MTLDELRCKRARTVGIVLAGTFAWDEDSFDTQIVRPLAPVVNVPLVVHVLNWMAVCGIRTVFICMNREGRKFRELLGDGSGLGLDLYYHEDQMPRGPAGCTADVAELVSADYYLVAEANTIPCRDADDLLSSVETDGADAMVVVSRSRDSSTENRDHLDPAGAYVFRRDAISDISPCGYEDIKEGLIPRLSRSGRTVRHIHSHRVAPRCQDSASYLELNQWALQELMGQRECPLRHHRRQDAVIEESAVLAPSVQVLGPCLLGAGTRVEDHAVIVGPTVVGRDCTIGAGSVICRSVIWDGQTILPNSKIDGQVITGSAGPRVNPTGRDGPSADPRSRRRRSVPRA